jgi:hypothetical protein
MRTPKQIDVLQKACWFDDTPSMVELLKYEGQDEAAKHLHKMHVYQKSLVAEIRKLRRMLNAALK